MERVCETLADLCDCQRSEGTLVNWIEQAARRLEFTQEQIKAFVLQRDLLPADETGVRIKGILYRVHVAATPFLRLYNWHRTRGQEARDAIGLLPNFAGRVMHDRWASSDQHSCSHSLCGAHLLRDCLFVVEQEK
jgi:hypothetical protein